MKIIKLIGGGELIVSDEDAELIAANFNNDQLIKLKTGE